MNVIKDNKVLVLMAIKNGLAFLPEQMKSILNQEGCQVTVFVSDDMSDDGSLDYVNRLARELNNVKFINERRIFGSAGKNFYRLLLEVDPNNYDYIAFADQDDIWELDKLSRHIAISKAQHADGVSSNVMAFWPDGRRKLIDKAQPQKQLDYVFESAGPGCTFLMTPWLVGKVREALFDETNPAREIALHDWLTYAVCRVHGRKWVIDPVPSLQYRQHQHNVLGANVGFKAKLARLAKLKQGWYRAEVIKIVEVCQRIMPTPDILKVSTLLNSPSVINRLRLLAFVPKVRRGFVDRFLLGFCILAGLF